MSSSIFFKEKFPAWIKSNRFLVTTTASLIVNLFLLDSISIKLVLIENIYIYIAYCTVPSTMRPMFSEFFIETAVK